MDTSPPNPTPLAAYHQSSGAHLGSWFGHALPDHFTDPREEQRFLNQSVALLDKSYLAYLDFTGPDRVRYLNAILTNNIKDLALGTGNANLLLNPQGRILAEFQVFALPDRLFAISHAMLRPRLIDWLEKYIIMDDVTLADDTDSLATLSLEGPQVAPIVQTLTATDFAAMPAMTTLDVAIRNPQPGRGAIPVRLVRLPSVPTFSRDANTASRTSPASVATPFRASSEPAPSADRADFIVARKDLPALWQILEAAARAAGGGPAGYSALSAQRLAQAIPWFGYDFGEKQIPHETGLEISHISYTKGCYTGQEIIERVRSRGDVKRRRALLNFEEGIAPADQSADPTPRTLESPSVVATPFTASLEPPTPGALESPSLVATPFRASLHHPTPGSIIFHIATEAGHITRAARSYYPPAILAMAYLRKESAAPGTVVSCGSHSATVINPLTP